MSEQNYISILGEKISVEIERRDIFNLRYFADNPRVYSKLTEEHPLPKNNDLQVLIHKKMLEEESVQKLIKTIKHHGGVNEPLLVQHKGQLVIEGNSRLAALRFLYEDALDNNPQDVIKYKSAPCMLVSLTAEQIDAYLYQIHDEGKTEWTPHAKALRAYRRVVNDSVDIKHYAKVIGQKVQTIQNEIDIIELMKKNEGNKIKTERFSYYESLVKNGKLRRSLENRPELKKYILKQVKKSNPDFNAKELRDDVPFIAQKSKVLKKFLAGKIDFELAKELSRVSQPKKYIEKAIDNLRQINKNSIVSLENNERNIVKLTAKKCRKEVERLQNMVDSVIKDA